MKFPSRGGEKGESAILPATKNVKSMESFTCVILSSNWKVILSVFFQSVFEGAWYFRFYLPYYFIFILKI